MPDSTPREPTEERQRIGDETLRPFPTVKRCPLCKGSGKAKYVGACIGCHGAGTVAR